MSKILYTHHTENEKSNVIQNGRGHQSYCTYCLAGVFFFPFGFPLSTGYHFVPKTYEF